MDVTPSAEADRAATVRRARPLLASLVFGLVLIGVGLAVGGEASQLALAGLAIAPFGLLAGLLQLGRVWAGVLGVAWAWFWLLLVGFALFTLGLTFGALGGAGDVAPVDGGERLVIASGLIGIGLLAAIALVVSGGWLRLGRLLGARPERGEPGHAQALVGLVFFAAVSILPLFVLGGEAPLLRIIARDDAPLTPNRSSAGVLLDLFYGLAWTIPFALIGAGFPVRRGLRAVLARLGLLPLRGRDLAILVGVAVGLAGLAFALDALTAAVWGWAGWQRTDTRALGRLFEDITSPVGAVGVGVTAGLGEELVARGLLQPRLGWLLPNLAFAAAHAFQYGPDGLLTVFIVGGILAGVRARWNTTASALTHGLYDFVLILGDALGAF